ncbi:hypothetical protein ONZ45_g7122 [Pleurotus djamor]|nr:hypothetical protein ONZ45_g7122 [Pleurotus djamor]
MLVIQQPSPPHSWTQYSQALTSPAPIPASENSSAKTSMDSHRDFDEKTGVSSSKTSTTTLPPSFSKSQDEKGKGDGTVAVTVSASSSIVEKGELHGGWEGFQDEEIPDKIHGHWLRNLRFQLLSMYRRIFGVVFIVNMSIFIAFLVRRRPNSKELGEIVIGNFFAAVLMRQDYVINAFFAVFTAVPLSYVSLVPGAVWLILFAVQGTIEVVRGEGLSIATLTMTYIVLLEILLMIFFAYPVYRTKRHDNFEQTHRFLGWTAVLFIWALVILLNNDYRAPGQTLGNALVHSAPFWLVVVLSMSIILPWLRLRHYDVRSEVLSDHAIRIYFDYVDPVPGSFVRLADDRHPLKEWHSFATIAAPGQKGYSVIISRAGDWTSKQIANPPTKMWIRGIPVCGVVNIVPMFRRVLLVGTGSGIAPLTPQLLSPKVPLQLLWISPDVRKTFGDPLVDALLTACPTTVLYDTRKHGKPDMVKLVYKVARDFDAEAVVIISNERLTKKVVYGLMSRGYPAFGAIWDS